ncbi:MAG: response regulator transcription factor [Acidimicrobiales bacterium]|jgi:DNA-binding NarL/FixJ family response regulator
MTGTTARTLRQKDASTMRAMVVCDDREVMRLGLVEMLVEMLQAMHWETDLRGFSTLPVAWAHLAGSTAPSAIAILGGTSAAKELEVNGRPARPPTQVVLMLRDSEAAHLAVAAGLPVDGYFLEEDLSVPMLRSLLARLDEREFPMPAPMAEFLLGQVRGFPSPLPVRLSAREHAVLQLIVDGATNKTIAEELGISVHGVKHHVANLLKQLGCTNRTEVASTAMRRGLVSTEPARLR